MPGICDTLNSTLFLYLHTEGGIVHDMAMSFKFHSVSISTRASPRIFQALDHFKFHSVSISTEGNTMAEVKNTTLNSTLFLYLRTMPRYL